MEEAHNSPVSGMGSPASRPETGRKPDLGYDEADEYRPEPPPPPEVPAWLDGSIRIGIHTSIAGDIVESLDRAAALGCNALQIFTASPRMWPGAGQMRIPEAAATRFRARRAELGLGPVVVHDNYLINLASTQRVLRARSIQAFHAELVRAAALGADFLVMHPGSRPGGEARAAIEAVAAGLQQAAQGVRLDGLRILIENTAGQGSVLGANLREVKAILDACRELPLGVCLDTAHLFAAGYDIRSEAGLERTLEEIGTTVGLERVFVLHMNDSKAPFGSRVDRHEHIGKGRIGLAAFRRILNHPLLNPEKQGLAGRAFIAETPIDRPGDDCRNVAALWKLAGKRVQAQRGAADGFPRATRAKKKPTRRRRGRGGAQRKAKARARARGRQGASKLAHSKRKKR